MRSILEFLEVHKDLSERFARHRDLVVGLEYAEALLGLDDFERELRRHMEAEERHVLPLYAERVGRVEGGDPDFFYAEHRNLLKNLASIKTATRALAEDPQAGRRQAHELLQQESLFLHLLQHHDLREKNILYPCLDRVLTDAERAALLAACGVKASRA